MTISARRPVLTGGQIKELGARILAMSSADTVEVSIKHTAFVVTRFANDHILHSEDGDELVIRLSSRFGDKQPVYVNTNQLDDDTLRMLVKQCELIAKERVGQDEQVLPNPQLQDPFIPVSLWKDETIQAMLDVRGGVIPEIIRRVTQENLVAAGCVALMARSEGVANKEGISAHSEETDSEVTVTVRTPDGKSSGWNGQAARSWSNIRYMDVAEKAIDIAKRGVGAQAFEPGRRTAILTSEAVAQIIRLLAGEYNAFDTDIGRTAFSRMPRGNKLGQRVFGRNISMNSDPADPEGGYIPYFGGGYGSPAMQWVENGILKNMAYPPFHAMGRGKQYAENPYSIRVSGGTTSIEQMIAQCEQGVYVNRFSDVDLLDLKTGLTTGVTRDGCFLVKNGKIDRPIKNFRFLDSPFYFLNSVQALGVSQRAAFGFSPPGFDEQGPTDWPRRPIIVPPMMIRDFNFSGLADAV